MKEHDGDGMAAIERELAAWRATHPHASFAEIETAVEARVRQIRARLLEQTVEAGFQEERPACPHCGTTMLPRTQTTRTVLVQGEEAVPVGGSYVVCPACGTGLFPPG